MSALQVERKRPYVSLRLKIWFVFLLVFVPTYVATYYWYYHFTVIHELDNLTTDLTRYADGIAATIDAEAFKALYEDEAAKNVNCPPKPGTKFSDPKNGYFPEDNPLFREHMEWLKKVSALEPDRSVYTYVKGPEQDYVITISSSWYFTNHEESFKFCQLYKAPNMYKGLSERVNVWEPYHDEYGYWITTYTPIKDKNGIVVGGVGIDVPAAQIVDIRKELLRNALIVFFVVILISIGMAYSLDQTVSKPLSRLTALTSSIKDGSSIVDFSAAARQRGALRDEIDNMASSVKDMMSRLNKQTSELSQSRAEMQELARGVIRSQENERKYISRELHSEAGQLLVLLKTTLEDLRLELDADGELNRASFQDRLNHAEKQIEKTLGVVRSISHQMRPSLLDVGDVNLALAGYCKEFAQRKKIEVTYEGFIVPNPPEELATSFYRFLQEALTNVSKHSSATQVWVRVQMGDNRIHMSVEDNGRGNHTTPTARGIGIAGLKERFFLLGGDVDAHSVDGGFVVSVSAPLDRS
jgi:signal transduction histidine kinase